MIMRHKIDFIIHWLDLQFDKRCPSPHCACLAGLQVRVSTSPVASFTFWILTAALARLTPFSSKETKAWGD